MTTSHQDRDFRAASGLAAWQADITQLTDPDQVLPRGPGLFEISRANGGRLVTNIRRLAGAERPPGSVLIATAAWLLTLIGGGALYVSFAAQRQYVFDARRQDMASIIEALLLDALMIVFTLLALGLSRAGKSSRAERALDLGLRCRQRLHERLGRGHRLTAQRGRVHGGPGGAGRGGRPGCRGDPAACPGR